MAAGDDYGAKEGIAVHLGTQRLSFDIPGKVLGLTVQIQKPLQLGFTALTYDSHFIDQGHLTGIPPHFLKAQANKESGINPNQYRYELISIDKNEFQARNGAKLARTPYSTFAFANHGRSDGTGLTAATIAPRTFQPFPLRIQRTGDASPRLVSDTETPPATAYELFMYNEGQQHWVKFLKKSGKLSYGCDRSKPACISALQNRLSFPAQTVVAASYGLMQTLYPSAIYWGWKGIGGSLDPTLLRDTAGNLNAHGSSLYVSSNRLCTLFDEENGSFEPAVGSYAELEGLFISTWNAYQGNRDPKNTYGPEIASLRPLYDPRPAVASVFP